MSETKRALEEAQTRLNRAACAYAAAQAPEHSEQERTIMQNRLHSAALAFEAALEAWADERLAMRAEPDLPW